GVDDRVDGAVGLVAVALADRAGPGNPGALGGGRGGRGPAAGGTAGGGRLSVLHLVAGAHERLVEPVAPRLHDHGVARARGLRALVLAARLLEERLVSA